MKWLFFSFIFVLAGVGMLFYGHRYDKQRLLAERHKETLLKEISDINEFSEVISTTKSKEKLLVLQARVKDLSESNRLRLEPNLQLAIAIVTFEEGEVYLAKAVEVNNALTLPPPPPPAPMIDKTTGQPIPQVPPPAPPLHPLVVKNLEAAFESYKLARELCDHIQQTGNDNFNFSLNYFKGEVYYRHTQFLSTPETAKELFDQTLICWKHALRYKPRDIDTVVNIELLIKNQNQMLSNSVQPSTNRPQMLPPQAGRGKTKGI